MRLNDFNESRYLPPGPLMTPIFTSPEAVAGPTAFNFVSSVIANLTSGKHLKALLVTSLTVSLLFVCTSWVRRGLNFPRYTREYK